MTTSQDASLAVPPARPLRDRRDRFLGLISSRGFSRDAAPRFSCSCACVRRAAGGGRRNGKTTAGGSSRSSETWTEPALGISGEDVEKFAARVGHFFHVAGLYDMTASDADLERINGRGRRSGLRGRDDRRDEFHHVSSIAAAGRYRGKFQEDMFEEA